MIRSLSLVALAALALGADPWEDAIAAGFPEVRGATVWVGAWRGSPHPVTDWAVDLGSEDLHLRLPDGRWLLHGLVLHPAADPEDLLEPAAVPWGSPGQPATRSWDPWGLRHQPAVAALFERAGLPLAKPTPAEQPEPLSADAVRQAVRHAAVLATQAQDRRALGQVLSTLDPATPVPDLAALPGWRLTYDPTTRDLLQERLQITPPGPGQPTTRGHRQQPPWQSRDLPGLLAALGDPAPSRTWTTTGHLVTVGDQALAALAWVWGLDAQRLAGTDGTALTHRLADLLARHGDLVTALSATPDLRHLLHLPTLVASLPPDRQAAAGATLAEDWSRLDPSARAALVASEDFGALLTHVGDVPAVVQVLSTWPVEGPLRPVLACWRDRRGDPAALDALLAESLAGEPTEALIACWTWALRAPTTARFTVLSQVVQRRLQDPWYAAVERCLSWADDPRVHGLQPNGSSWPRDQLLPAWWVVQDANYRSRSRPSSVARRLDGWGEDGQPAPTPATLLPELALRAHLRGTPLPDQTPLPPLPAWWQEELAKAQGRPVLLHLTATVGCWPCEAFHSAVTSRPGWTAWATGRLHHVVIDAVPSNPVAGQHLSDLSRLYGVAGVPHLLLLGPDGVQRGPGLTTTRDLAAFIAQVEGRLAALAPAP